MLYVRGDSVLQWTDRRTDRQTDGQTGVMGVFRCVCALLCVCVSVSVCVKLLDEAVAFSGPSGSLFGFSLDFHTINNRSFVVIGAPKASTNQSGVEEGGAVYLCPWTTGDMTSSSSCNVVNFEAAGDQQTYSSDGVLVQTFRSHQWFGASLRSLADGQLLACAPLFHWNVHRWGEESGRTPVGTCLVLDQRTGDSAPFSPCRATLVEEDYKRMKNRNDQRYCEVGFSADITQDGRLLFGAPGSFYFQGQVFAVTLRDLLSSGRSSELRPFLQQPIGVSQSDERGDYDVYRGYSVASGQLTGDSTPDLLVGVPNDRNTAGTVTVYDGRSQGALRVVHTFLGAQVASYFGHSVSVADVNSDGMDDVLIGAPLFMTRVTEQLQERGQVVLYLQRNRGFFGPRPDQSLDGFTVYGRFGSALAPLGDLDMDGYQDVAVGAPWSGDGGRGQVFIYLGKEGGLSATPTQVIDSPTASGGRAAFGFALRGGVDIDGNGFPDLLVGGWAADRAFVYRSRAVIGSRLSLTLLPDFLQPEVRECQLLDQLVTCFLVKMCIHLSGHRIPEQTDVGVELQLDRMKQPIARRTLLLSTNQPQGSVTLAVPRDVGVACTNWTAYLRPEEEVRDKLSPIFITAEVNLLNSTHNALLHGQTYTATQTRIILDCGEDNVCVPDLQLSVAPASRSVLVGADQSVKLLVRAENRGEGAYETELLVQIPEHTHFQSSQGVNRLVCVQRKHNHTVVVICDLGNPMRQGHTVQTGLLFSVGGLEDVHSHINFSLVIRSKNPSSSNQVTVSVWVEAAAALEIRGGSSPPEVVLSLPDWLPAVHAGSGEEEAEGGVLVEHVYEVRNLGPATVNGRLTVHFPSTWRHHFLLLVSPNASQEALSCRSLNASHAHLPPSSGSRVPAVAQWDQQGETVTVNCSSSDAGCVRFVCDFTGLRRGFSSVVRISATLWTHTLIQTPYLNYELVSSAFYDVINVSSRVQPLQLPSGNTQTQLRVLWRPPGERDVPIGYMLLSVMAGLLLLSMLSLIFWKLGFFQRTRPPTDDDEDQCVCEEAPMTG